MINFFLNNISIRVPQRKKLKQYIKWLFEREGKVLLNLTYVFCSDNELLSINNEFLGHDNYTDIITFCLSGPGESIDGEIYISVERVKENAEILGVSFKEELHRVIFHGALHLCGYKDKKPAEKRTMTNAEDKYLKDYFS